MKKYSYIIALFKLSGQIRKITVIAGSTEDKFILKLFSLLEYVTSQHKCLTKSETAKLWVSVTD